jgi:hypothetical protein
MQVVDLRHARRWLSFIIPKEPARYVLEIDSQRKYEFQIGDRIHFEEIDPR